MLRTNGPNGGGVIDATIELRPRPQSGAIGRAGRHTMSKHHASEKREDSWRVEVSMTSDGNECVAVADLFFGNAIYESHGGAPRNAVSPTAAEELAVARALSGLAHQLVENVSREVDAAAHAVEDYAALVDSSESSS